MDFVPQLIILLLNPLIKGVLLRPQIELLEGLLDSDVVQQRGRGGAEEENQSEEGHDHDCQADGEQVEECQSLLRPSLRNRELEQAVNEEDAEGEENEENLGVIPIEKSQVFSKSVYDVRDSVPVKISVFEGFSDSILGLLQ